MASSSAAPAGPLGPPPPLPLPGRPRRTGPHTRPRSWRAQASLRVREQTPRTGSRVAA